MDRREPSLSTRPSILNPYYANPFFRPRILPQQQTKHSRTILASPSNCDSSIMSIPSSATSSTLNPLVEPVEARRETQPPVILTSAPDEHRRWAHSITAASMARRAVSNDYSTAPVKPSTIHVSDVHTYSSSTDCIHRSPLLSRMTRRSRRIRSPVIWSSL